MKKLLEYADEGDTVVVWRVDRLGRSLIDVLNTVNMLRDRGILVRSLSDGIDPATSTGRLMLNMLATLAEYERELIVERINAGIAASRQNGTKFGRPAVNPKVIADKLAIAADARAKGRTAEEAARLVGWSRATLYRHQQALAVGAQSPSTAALTRKGTHHMSASDPLPEIGAPATQALAQVGVVSMEDLKGVDLDELSKLHGVGPKAIRLLQEALHKHENL
jgi:DNA invertase Pin-like site-specific DNA recombinase